ncbi:N-methyl-L-tryptophan oxidase [Antarcticirhabdus aurantiaca]|uniref:N-methyl-L-tryptophan oxidase n=1 Tax=Antarcticirhabdus aurantiaca TaxID=2606717 RepID=A0ACD4NNT3_9HYPH|nr:N-methyl-L-tryptophan oxidase [Antarcticirhabdus aurantiaca]WAJ28481.1 N-methyl-L-tryptophan oxidase [Jeongeuplla avenae]
MDFDFIVVGTGSVGAAAAFHASRSGLKVLMVDNGHPPHDLGSHHGQTRLMRHAYGEGEKYVPTVLRAQALWEELERETGERIFERTGVVNIGPAGAAFLGRVRASAERWNLALQVMGPAEVRARWPQMTLPDGLVALYEPGAGVLRSEASIRAHVRLARDAGAVEAFGTPVRSVASDGNGVTVVADGGRWRARKVLVSAGTWTTTLFPELPVTPVRKIFTWHETDGRYEAVSGFPGFVSELPSGNQFYGFPAEDGILKIGRHNGGQPIGSPDERLPFGALDSDAHEVSEFLDRVLPGVGAIRHGASCTYDNSPDEDFVVDTLPGQPDVMVVAGLSGHGFKFASVLGEIAAGFAGGRNPGFDLSPFSLSRFGQYGR